MKPQVYPETRGSHLAGELERERARKNLERLSMGKSRNQKRTERNNRRAKNKRRKFQQQAEEFGRSRTMEQQQSIPMGEPAITHGRNPPVRKKIFIDKDSHMVIRACCLQFTSVEMGKEWTRLGLYSRNTASKKNAQSPGLRVLASNAAQFLAHVAGTEIGTHATTAGFAKDAKRFAEQMRPRLKEAPTANSLHHLSSDEKRELEELRRKVADYEDAMRRYQERAERQDAEMSELRGMMKQILGKANEPVRQENVDYRPQIWDDLNTHIRRASKDDRKFSARWISLRAQFELKDNEDTRPLIQRARDMGIDTTSDESWLRELCYRKPVLFVQGLLDLAREIFPAQAA